MVGSWLEASSKIMKGRDGKGEKSEIMRRQPPRQALWKPAVIAAERREGFSVLKCEKKNKNKTK